MLLCGREGKQFIFQRQEKRMMTRHGRLENKGKKIRKNNDISLLSSSSATTASKKNQHGQAQQQAQ